MVEKPGAFVSAETKPRVEALCILTEDIGLEKIRLHLLNFCHESAGHLYSDTPALVGDIYYEHIEMHIDPTVTVKTPMPTSLRPSHADSTYNACCRYQSISRWVNQSDHSSRRNRFWTDLDGRALSSRYAIVILHLVSTSDHYLALEISASR
jgi:hypothetical protein